VLRALLERARQGHRTLRHRADRPPELPARFRGLPVLRPERCGQGCRTCIEACPTEALALEPSLRLDLGRCLFCAECETACPGGAIEFTRDPRLATRSRDELTIGEEGLRLARALDQKSRRVFGRSLRLRQLSAGGCNGCELEINVLSTVVFDLARYGVEIVASPRHADGLIITGPVTSNMRLALENTFAAVPAPKIVIAVGACAISGGPYRGHPEAHDGAASLLAVDLFVPGCPPHPHTILDAILRLLDRAQKG
jgi:Ni,Fe-hydrogenase III small subunit/ferredoxin